MFIRSFRKNGLEMAMVGTEVPNPLSDPDADYLPFGKHRGSHVLWVESQVLGGRNSEHTLKTEGN